MKLNHIYHGDSKALMKSWPSKSVDLIITDPPYGMEYHSGRYSSAGGNPHSKIQGDDKFPVDALEEMFRLARGGVFAFCRWDNLKELPPPKSFLVWVKNNWSAGDLEHAYGRQWEGCAFWPMEEHKFLNRPADVIDCRRVPPTQLLHPTQKPLELIEAIIRDNAGQIILDPFAGSCTTAVAAARLGRSYVAIELEEKYVRIGEQRILNEGGQASLF